MSARGDLLSVHHEVRRESMLQRMVAARPRFSHVRMLSAYASTIEQAHRSTGLSVVPA